jgi:hypothetical protein
MASGPSVRWVFVGVGISDRKSALAPVAVVVADGVLVALGALDAVVLLVGEVPLTAVVLGLLLALFELGELPQLAATSPTTVTAAATMYVPRAI